MNTVREEWLTDPDSWYIIPVGYKAIRVIGVDGLTSVKFIRVEDSQPKFTPNLIIYKDLKVNG